MRTQRYAFQALQDLLECRIADSGHRGVARPELLRLAQRQGFTLRGARAALHQLSMFGRVEHVTDRGEIRVRIAQGGAV